MNARIGVADCRAALVSDASYLEVARRLIQCAVHECLCSLFIVDPDPEEPGALLVDELLRDLAGARWRGVDARLLIGGSRSNGRILDACLLARERAGRLGVDARLLAASDQRSDHAKLMVVDDQVLLGSHNWSPGALGGQTQDSVLIQHEALGAYLGSRFEAQWRLARKEGFDVPR